MANKKLPTNPTPKQQTGIDFLKQEGEQRTRREFAEKEVTGTVSNEFQKDFNEFKVGGVTPKASEMDGVVLPMVPPKTIEETGITPPAPIISPPPPETVEEAAEDTKAKQIGAQAETEKQLEGIETVTEDRIKEEEEVKEKDVEEVEGFREQQEALIKERDAKIAEQQAEIDRIAEDRKTRDVALIEKEAEAAKKVAEQELALHKKQTEEAIMQAEVTTEVERQKSAWAFNKLGLGFSSGIVLQSQTIATNGAIKLATLKVQAAKDHAELQFTAQKIQLDYTKETNRIIDKYTDVQLQNKRDIIDRIDDTNANLLLNNEQKQKEKRDLEEKYRLRKRELEDKMRTEQERLADKAVAQAEDLEATMRREQADEKIKVDQSILTGNFATQTPTDIAATERRLGLTPGTLTQRFEGDISSSIRAQFDTFLGRDYPIENMNELIADAKQEMAQGRSFEEAIINTMGRELKTNKEYQRRLKAEEDKRAAEAAKARGAGVGKATEATEKENRFNQIAAYTAEHSISLPKWQVEALGEITDDEVLAGTLLTLKNKSVEDRTIALNKANEAKAEGGIDLELSQLKLDKAKTEIKEAEKEKLGEEAIKPMASFPTTLDADQPVHKKVVSEVYNNLTDAGFTQREALEKIAEQVDNYKVNAKGDRILDEDIFSDDPIIFIDNAEVK